MVRCIYMSCTKSPAGDCWYVYIEHEVAQGRKNLTCSNIMILIIQTDFLRKHFSTFKYLNTWFWIL